MKASARHKARKLALQALYQWHMSGGEPQVLVSQYLENSNQKKVDTEYVTTLINRVINEQEELDKEITPILDRPLKDLTPIELTVLRIAVYELEHQLEIPYRVIINEALELTKIFGAEDSFKYINGVLDKIAKRRIDYAK